MKPIRSSPFCCSRLFCLLLIPSLVVSPLAAQGPPTASAPTLSEVAGPINIADLQLRVVEGSALQAKVGSTWTKALTVAVTNAAGGTVTDAAVALRLPDSGPTGSFSDGSHAAVAYTDVSGQARFVGLHWSQTPGMLSMRVTATKGNSHAALLVNETLTSDSTTVVEVLAPAVAVTPAAAAAPAALQVAPAMPQPGQTASSQPPAKNGASPALVTSTLPVSGKPEPRVSVTGASPEGSQHSGKTKWIIIAAVVAAAAGAGIAVAGKGKSSAAPASSGLTIGTPSVSVGAPH